VSSSYSFILDTEIRAVSRWEIGDRKQEMGEISPGVPLDRLEIGNKKQEISAQASPAFLRPDPSP